MGGAAGQRQQPPPPPQRRRHLVHHPARRPHHPVLRLRRYYRVGAQVLCHAGIGKPGGMLSAGGTWMVSSRSTMPPAVTSKGTTDGNWATRGGGSLAGRHTIWHRMASCRGGRSSCSAAAKAAMLATSSAAEDDTPAPGGTSEATSAHRLIPNGTRAPHSCISTSSVPATYAAQLQEHADGTSAAATRFSAGAGTSCIDEHTEGAVTTFPSMLPVH